MLRDLQQLWAEATEQTLSSIPDLSEQPNNHGRDRSAAMDAEWSWGREQQGPGVRVYPKALTLSDLDSCCILEDAAFPPEQRCTREKAGQVMFDKITVILIFLFDFANAYFVLILSNSTITCILTSRDHL